MRKLYKVRIRVSKRYPTVWNRVVDGDLDEYLLSGRQDSGYIQQIASSPRVAANRAWAGSVQHSQLRDDEEVTITVQLAEANE